MLDALYYDEAKRNRMVRELVRKMTSGKLTKKEFNREYRRNHILRDGVVKHSWVVVVKEWLDSLEKLTRGKAVLEVCAGSGLVSALMRKRNCDWVATDKGVGKNNRYKMISNGHVVEMEAMDAVSRFKPDVLFVSWIDYESELDCELAELGLPMILVGERWGGCTGSDKFWEKYGESIIDADKFDWFVDIPQWDAIHDYTSLVHWDFVARKSDGCVCVNPDLIKNIASGKEFSYCRSCKNEKF